MNAARQISAGPSKRRVVKPRLRYEKRLMIKVAAEIANELAAAENRYLQAQRRLHKNLRLLANYLEEIAQLDARDVRGEEAILVHRNCHNFADILDQQVAVLAERLHAAFAQRFEELEVRPLINLYLSAKTRSLFGTAYFRDRLVTSLLRFHLACARRSGDQVAIARVEKFWGKWDQTDKGPLSKSKAALQALNILRKAYALRGLVARTKYKAKFESALLAPVRESLFFHSEVTDFERELARAKRFRANRLRPRPVTITEEFDLRTDLTGCGIVCQLFGRTNVGSVDDLMKQFAPGYPDRNKSNFRKLLDECFVPWTRRKRGRPLGSKNKVRR